MDQSDHPCPSDRGRGTRDSRGLQLLPVSNECIAVTVAMAGGGGRRVGLGRIPPNFIVGSCGIWHNHAVHATRDFAKLVAC